MNSEMRASSLELKLGASQKKWELLMPQRSVTVIIGIGTTKSCEWPKKPAIHNDKETFFLGGSVFYLGGMRILLLYRKYIGYFSLFHSAF